MPVNHEAIQSSAYTSALQILLNPDGPISVAFIVVKCLAVILTLCRLGFRIKIQRFWWEDVWAVIALLCTVVSIISSVLAVSGPRKCF